MVTGLEKKKTKFLWPTSEHKGIRLEVAILFLDGDISEKLVYESATFLFTEISFWSLVLKKKKNLWPTSEHRGQEFGERSIVP